MMKMKKESAMFYFFLGRQDGKKMKDLEIASWEKYTILVEMSILLYVIEWFMKSFVFLFAIFVEVARHNLSTHAPLP